MNPRICLILKWSGAALAVAGLAGTVIFASLVLSNGSADPGTSIAAWILFPALFYLGILLLLAAGICPRIWGRLNGSNEQKLRLTVDFSDSATWRRILLLLPPVALLLGASAFTTHEAYEFTESDTFCASTCHEVMAPERITHNISPHAQVQCSTCHVGPTLTDYVEAKLFGIKELYLLLSERYPKPIPTPIQNLRVVRENCFGCHWEEKYWGKVHRDYSHFIASNDNQLWSLQMNVKVGGRFRLGSDGEGIHWHMKLEPNVSYIARDSQLQDIPWIKLVRESGEEIIYESTAQPLSPEELAELQPREMACIDCHNRPAHQFKAPLLAVDDAMARGLIDPSIPEVKSVSVKLLSEGAYPTQEEAKRIIREQFLTFYREGYPDLWETAEGAIHAASDALELIYGQNFFPEMKADWRAYPDNIGHFFSPGCFRCHDGLHVNADGDAISNDCSLCHDIVAQGPPDDLEHDSSGLPFRHPVDFGVPVMELGQCTDCHDGALGE